MSNEPLTARAFRLPLVVTLLVIAWVVTFHSSMLSLGAVSHIDETFTLDRSTAFLAQNDWWNVYTNNKVNFNKPPLQYWMSALLIDRGVDLTLALRIPSFVFGALCLFATALFAYSLFPTLPWVMPVSVLFATSSDRLWESSMMAMLDMGSLFFVTLALSGINLALRNPKWWYLVGFCVAVGAWQKAPIALGFVGGYLVFLALTSPWHQYSIRQVFLNRHLWISLGAGILFGASWHIWQFIQHGSFAVEQAIGKQMVGRFTPSGESGETKSIREVLSHIFGAEGAIRLFGLIAVFAVPFYSKRYDLLPIPMILLAYMIAYAFAGGHLSDRYTMLFITMVAVFLAGAILSSAYTLQTKAMTILIMSLLSGGPVKPPDELRLFPKPHITLQTEILTLVGQNAEIERTLIICNWNPEERINPGFVTYYASGGRSHHRINSLRQLEVFFSSGKSAGPIEGICRDLDFKDLERFLSDIEVLNTVGPYVHFHATPRTDI